MEKRRDIAREIARRYGNLTPEQLDQLSETIVPINVHKGVSILKRGDVCKSIYYVDHGLIRQYYYKNNKEVTEHIAYEGGIVMCIESLFKREPSISPSKASNHPDSMPSNTMSLRNSLNPRMHSATFC